MSIPDFANEPIVRPASSSQLEDMITVIPAPATAFEHRRDGKFGIAMLVTSAIVAVIAFLQRNAMAPIVDAEFTRGMHAAMVKNPQITEQMVGKMRDSAEKFGWLIALLTPVLICVIGLSLWLLGKVVGSRQTASQGIAVATFAFVPRIIQAVVGWAQVLLMNPDNLDGVQRISLSPARFMDPNTTSPLTLALLGRLDLFILWSTVLLAIGLSVTGKVTRRQGAVGAFLVWLLATAFAAWGAIRNMA